MTIQYYLQDAGGSVGIVGTGMSIPPDPENTEYKQYLQWVKDGGVVTPLPDDAPGPLPVINGNETLPADSE